MTPRDKYSHLKSKLDSSQEASAELVLETGLAALMCYEIDEAISLLHKVEHVGSADEALKEALAKALFLAGETSESQSIARSMLDGGAQKTRALSNILGAQPQEPALPLAELKSVDFEAPYGTLFFYADIVCSVCGAEFSYSWTVSYLLHRVIRCPECLSRLLLTYSSFADCWKSKFGFSLSRIEDLDNAVVHFAKHWYEASSLLRRRFRVHGINLGPLLEFFTVLFLSNLVYRAVGREADCR